MSFWCPFLNYKLCHIPRTFKCALEKSDHGRPTHLPSNPPITSFDHRRSNHNFFDIGRLLMIVFPCSAFYVGVSSLSENLTISSTFQGSMLRLDIATGKIKWKTKVLPDNGGKPNLFAGAGIWGSSPPIDVKRNLVYSATGNLYSVPPDVLACQLREANKTVPDTPDPCVQVKCLHGAHQLISRR